MVDESIHVRLDPPRSEPKEKGRLFIVGNGPSLNDTPLGLLMGEESWAMARIHTYYDRTFWRPTRYFYGEYISTEAEKEDVLFNINLGYEVWLRADILRHFSHIPSHVTPWATCPLKHTGTRTHLPDGQLNHNWPVKWHLDPKQNWLCKAGPTTNAVLQQAYHEGWDPIYLVGFDLGYKATTHIDPNHFDPKYTNRKYDEVRAYHEEETHKAMHRAAWSAFRKKGTRIYNATEGGALEIYPRVDFRSLFDSDSGERAKSATLIP